VATRIDLGDPLLSTEQIGHLCGFSAGTARTLARAGAFGPIVKTGTDPQRGRVYAYNSAVEAWLTERTRQRVKVEATHTENAVLAELLRRRAERGRQRKAS
jgi:hypothetical protein